MKKYLVTIEFRYTSKREYQRGGNMRIDKTITIGVFDDLDSACIEGNKMLEVLESKFKIHVYPQGNEVKRQRFSKNGFLGTPNTLVTNLAYLQTPFEFYAKITTLHYEDTAQAIEEVLKDLK